MKKYALLLPIIICVLALSAQDTKLVFGSPTVVWYGMDFTKLKMIGFKDESPHTIRDQYFKEWNAVTLSMDLAKVFKKNTVANDVKGVTQINSARETDALLADAEVELSKADIAAEVKLLPPSQQKKGLAVVFIAQSFNKTQDLATVHVVFFNIETREVLWSKKVTAKSSGGSTSKAWAGAMKTIITNIDKKDFAAWKKEANY